MNYKDYVIELKKILINKEFEKEIEKKEEIENIINNEYFIKFLEETKKKYNYVKMYNFSSKEYFYKFENDLLLFNILELICKKKLKEMKFNNYIFEFYELSYYNIDNRIQLLNIIMKEYYDICLNYYNLSNKYKKDFMKYKQNIKEKICFLKEKKKNLNMKDNLHYIFNEYYKKEIKLLKEDKFNFEEMNVEKKYLLTIDFYEKFNIKDNVLIEFIIELLYKKNIENLHLLFKYIKYFVYKYDYSNIENKLIDKLLEYYIKIEKDNSIYDYEKINMKKNLIYFCDNIFNENINKKINEKILINFTYILLTDISNNILEFTKIDKELQEVKNTNNHIEINLLIKEKNYYLILLNKFNNIIKKSNIKILLKKEIINKYIIVENDLLNLLVNVFNEENKYKINKYKINDILNLYYKINLENSDEFIKNMMNDERYTNNKNFFEMILEICNTFLIDNKENIEIINIIINKIEEKIINSKIEIPEKYCDPLYYTLINNPIELPNTVIMEEQIIREYLLLRNENPFNRTYLDLELLETYNENEEVKKRINSFKEELLLWKKNNNIN